MPPVPGCPRTGPSSPEVTRAICLVPSAHFSQAPEYTQPAHLCRFRVRSIWRGYFLEPAAPPAQSDKGEQVFRDVTSSRPGNVNPVPIDYGFRPRLRGRLTLRRLTLRRNPWTFGGSVSHTPLVTHVCIRTSDTSRSPHGSPFTGLRNAPLPRACAHPQLRCMALAPLPFRRKDP